MYKIRVIRNDNVNKKATIFLNPYTILVANTSILTFAGTTNSISKSNTGDIKGYYNYPYENAPKAIRAEHEGNCKSIDKLSVNIRISTSFHTFLKLRGPL